MNNTRKKIMVIFGTRPEASKMCPVIKELKCYSDWFETKSIPVLYYKFWFVRVG